MQTNTTLFLLLLYIIFSTSCYQRGRETTSFQPDFWIGNIEFKMRDSVVCFRFLTLENNSKGSKIISILSYIGNDSYVSPYLNVSSDAMKAYLIYLLHREPSHILQIYEHEDERDNSTLILYTEIYYLGKRFEDNKLIVVMEEKYKEFIDERNALIVKKVLEDLGIDVANFEWLQIVDKPNISVYLQFTNHIKSLNQTNNFEALIDKLENYLEIFLSEMGNKEEEYEVFRAIQDADTNHTPSLALKLLHKFNFMYLTTEQLNKHFFDVYNREAYKKLIPHIMYNLQGLKENQYENTTGIDLTLELQDNISALQEENGLLRKTISDLYIRMKKLENIIWQNVAPNNSRFEEIKEEFFKKRIFNSSIELMSNRGFREIYEKNYSMITNSKDLSDILVEYNNRSMICAGAEHNSNIAKMSCGILGEVLKETCSNTEAYFNGGAFWYNSEDYAFGFAESPDIYLNHQEKYDMYNDTSEQRMSWALSGNRGGRLGANLTFHKEMLKVIYILSPQ